jgi:hypothetical protein
MTIDGSGMPPISDPLLAKARAKLRAEPQLLRQKPPPLPPAYTPLEGPHAAAHHAHVSLEGPRAADRRRPHIGHVSLEGSHPPLRAALDRRFVLEGPPHDLIRRKGIGPALISTNRRK